MGTILMIMAVPFLYATGIYNPPVVHHGRCIAEPGTFGTHFTAWDAQKPRRSIEHASSVSRRGGPVRRLSCQVIPKSVVSTRRAVESLHGSQPP